MTRTILLSALLLVSFTSSRIHSAEPQAALEPDIVYGHKDGLALTMDLYHPEADANGAAVMFMVSGGWVSRWSPPKTWQPLFIPHLEKGYTVVAIRR